ncbi:hypothetical protein C1X05_06340 [Laceyella sacchari]|nr:hypothetical protein C1X05_06340 [Laceyella sacchari]
MTDNTAEKPFSDELPVTSEANGKTALEPPDTWIGLILASVLLRLKSPAHPFLTILPYDCVKKHFIQENFLEQHRI